MKNISCLEIYEFVVVRKFLFHKPYFFLLRIYYSYSLFYWSVCNSIILCHVIASFMFQIAIIWFVMDIFANLSSSPITHHNQVGERSSLYGLTKLRYRDMSYNSILIEHSFKYCLILAILPPTFKVNWFSLGSFSLTLLIRYLISLHTIILPCIMCLVL